MGFREHIWFYCLRMISANIKVQKKRLTSICVASFKFEIQISFIFDHKIFIHLLKILKCQLVWLIVLFTWFRNIYKFHFKFSIKLIYLTLENQIYHINWNRGSNKFSVTLLCKKEQRESCLLQRIVSGKIYMKKL